MPIQASDFLTSASALVGDRAEISVRNCVSRAYYFAYHEAKSLVDTLPGGHLDASGEGGVHQQVIWHLLHMREKDPKFPHAAKAAAVGYVLREMKAVRVNADYNLDWNPSGIDSESQISKAKKLQQKVAELATAVKSKVA